MKVIVLPSGPLRPSRLWQQHLALESVRIAEEDALRRAEVVDRAVAGSGVDQPAPDCLEGLRGRGGQPNVIDATTAPHRGLAIGLGVAVDHEDVQLSGRPDIDHGHRLARPVATRGSDDSIEHHRVKPAKPIDVLGDPGDVVHTVQQHR